MSNSLLTVANGEVVGLKGASNGQVPKWNSSTQAWEAGTDESGGGGSLPAATDGQILISNGTAYSSHSVSGDATLTNSGALTVTGLQGNDVSNAAPANNQTLVWSSSASAWVPGASLQGGSGGGGVVLYLNYQTSGASPTTGLTSSKQMGPLATDTANSVTSANLSQSVYDLVATFVTDVGYPGVTSIPAGLWDFNFWASSTGTVTNQTIVQIQVYKYNGTTATLLATSDDISIYDPSVTAQYIGNVTMPQTTILDTDRIVVELRGKATANNKTITFNFGGNTPAHLHTTLPSVAGTGLVKAVNGAFQSPASTLVNADVASNAAIGVSKLANGSSGQILVAGASNLAYQTMSGDATINASGALTLANSGVSANTYGSASSVPVAAVDAKGRVTSVTDTPILLPYTVQRVTVTSATGLTVGKVVAWDSSNGLVLADNTVEAKTHLAGVIHAANGTTIDVRTSGTVALNDIGSSTRGTAIYLDTSGNAQEYSTIASGEYIVLLGYVSDATAKEITYTPQNKGTRA